jgi:hypothetical protein
MKRAKFGYDPRYLTTRHGMEECDETIRISRRAVEFHESGRHAYFGAELEKQTKISSMD